MNFAEKYANEQTMSLESLPTMTVEAQERVDQLKAQIKANRMLIMSTNYDDLIRISAFIKAGETMKEATGDGIDDIDQNNKALAIGRIINGLLRENGVTLNQYLRGEF